MILSDILDRPVEVPVQPQNVGSVGAALTAAAGAGVIADLEEASRLIRPESVYYPGSCGPEGKAAYEKNYQVFRKLYSSNKKLFAQLNPTKADRRFSKMKKKMYRRTGG